MKNLFSIILSLTLACDVTGAQERVNIIPPPQHVVLNGTFFKIGAGTKILLDDSSVRERFIAGQVNDELKTFGRPPLQVVVVQKVKRLPKNSIFVGSPSSEIGRKLLDDRKGTLTPRMNKEGYFLQSDANGVVIIASSSRGRFYGVMTLLQMMQREGRGITVVGAAISDFPLIAFRGISDDISRGQVSTVENFKKIIRVLARYKINAYALYIEDMFAFKKYPLIGKGRGALTAEEIKGLDAYAKQYYVDLIPIFQTLGHWENILYLPEYVQYAEYPGGRTLNVSDGRVYTILDEMIREISSAFSSAYFNMGADETRDVGLGANKARVATLGLPTVLADHYKRVATLIEKRGKKPMMYADIILKNPQILTMLPKNIIMVDWDYDPRFEYDTPMVFKKAGFQYIVSPAVRSYAGPFLDYLNSFENIQRFSRAGYQDSSLGVLTSSWNDYGAEEFRELNYYGYAWAAECSWHPLRADVASFNDEFFKDFFGTSEDDPFKAAYAILSSPANHYSWYELWRDPMLPLLPPTPHKGHPSTIMDRLQSIKSTMPIVLSLLKECEQLAVRDADQLKYLEFVARLNLWFAQKVEAEQEVQRLSKSAGKGIDKDSVANGIVSLCAHVVKELIPLRSEVQQLWLSTNKPEGLDNVLRRWDRQTAFWQEKMSEVQRGTFWVDPELESKWIYYPTITPQAGDTIRVQHAWFRKQFVRPSDLRSATLQLIGDTYVKLWVDSVYVGEVYARRSNSLSAEYKRVKVFDILPLLKDSVNVLAAEAQDFSENGSGGLNIYCELQESNGSVDKIVSDTTWSVTDTVSAGWQSVSYDDARWIRPGEKKYPYEIVRPDFATGRSSWIEQ